MLLLATTFCCLSLVEFTAICPQFVPQSKSAMETLVHQLLVVTLGAVLCVSAWTGGKLIHDALNLGATLTSFVFHIATTKKMDQTALIKLLLDLFALMYVVNGFSHALLLRGALVAGSYMGHAKLALVVSPGKTLVGAIAGVLSSVATVLVIFALPQLATVLRVVGQWTQDLLPPLDVVPFAHQIVLGTILWTRCYRARLTHQRI
ncbi:Phosphatidate cytidylyltransferase [Phytophthora megakarya]|uniref:Phosphatidate cytidylyltransferase n=1 Tax=Phytophthora megakarya TaxID=4795 RepID=A0A225UVE1_9STRA|nr:Phosphatidate cytidylyltransferase [Phytophthora megakarya]